MPLNPSEQNKIGILFGNSESPFFASAYPSGDRSTSGLVQISILNYQGAFRLPTGPDAMHRANYSNGPIAINTTNNSIFISGEDMKGTVGEFNIPTIVNSEVASDLNTATLRQDFVDIYSLATRASEGEHNGVIITGMAMVNDKLLVNSTPFYAQSPYGTSTTLVINNPDDIGLDVDGYLELEGKAYAAGWITEVPVAWRAALGGPHIGGLTSSTARALVHNSSVGPAAFTFDAFEMADDSDTLVTVATNELMKYTIEYGLVATSNDNDDVLYNYDLDNDMWTHVSEGSFGMILPNTDTYMVLGFSGGHESGLGYGTAPYPADYGHYTNVETDRGCAYWLIDVNDLAEVKAGTKNSYDVVPYAKGLIDVPFFELGSQGIRGGAYDDATGKLYLCMHQADTDQLPLITVYTLDGVA